MSRLAIIFALLLPCVGLAEPTLFRCYKATISLNYVTREPDKNGNNALVTRKLTNKQLINLAQGRAAEALVPKNEILIALIPDLYELTTSTRIVLMDAATSTIIKTITTTENVTATYGQPDGAVQAVGTGTLYAQAGPDMAIAQTVLSLSLKASGPPAKGPQGPPQATNIISVSGPLTVTIGATARNAIITSGSVRITGKNLLDLFIEL